MKFVLLLIVTFSSLECFGQLNQISKSKEIVNSIDEDNYAKKTLSKNDSISSTNNIDRLEIILEKKEKIGKLRNKKRKA